MVKILLFTGKLTPNYTFFQCHEKLHFGGGVAIINYNFISL